MAPGPGYARGEGHYAAKLTERDVRAIRRTRNRTQRELAAQYGVSPSAISFVVRRVNWKHVN